MKHNVTCTLSPVPLRDTRITGGFWHKRQQINRKNTIPIEYDQCKNTGRIDAWTWNKGQPNEPHYFWDSDVAKWIEAVAYSLVHHPDKDCESLVDAYVDLAAAGQLPDGYLNSYFSRVKPEQRWANLRDYHELYCAGHLIEGAVAYYEATGKRKFLDILCRYVDYIAATFGRGPGQKRGYCGHEEIELALLKLYRVTGDRKHLDLVRYFVDERGRQPHYFDIEHQGGNRLPEWLNSLWKNGYGYSQAHKPVREQDKVVGHAVRAMYLYTAMAEMAGEIGDEELLKACRHLWDDLLQTKLYVTGGIGSSASNEGFTADYDLPNQSAYAETCASVGLVFWAQRLLQLDGQGKYADLIEKCLYNGIISGLSLDGRRFFYVNPLESKGTHHRQDWFECACCPPNVARLIASLNAYLYSTAADGLYVHHYVSSETRLQCNGTPVTVQQETNYPWDETVSFIMQPEKPARFTLYLRIPGWARKTEVRINGVKISKAVVKKGYSAIRREWKPQDRVELHLAMPVEMIEARPEVAADCGRVAIQRGPVIYCLESVDNGAHLNDVLLPGKMRWKVGKGSGALANLPILSGQAYRRTPAGWGHELYRPVSSRMKKCVIKAIPYFAWDNRAGGEMLVWIRSSPCS